jgi:hypothetical protein
LSALDIRAKGGCTGAVLLRFVLARGDVFLGGLARLLARGEGLPSGGEPLEILQRRNKRALLGLEGGCLSEQVGFFPLEPFAATPP